MASTNVKTHWDFDGTDEQLFFCVNGKRMVNEKNQELEVEQIGYGRSSGDLWVKFKEAKVGRNISIDCFLPKSEFCKKHRIHCTSVTDLIEIVIKQCPNISIHKRSSKRKLESGESQAGPKKNRLIFPATEAHYSRYELPSVRFIANLIGKFEVNVLTLQEPPKEYISRKINHEWVNTLKQKIMKDPQLVTSVLPVLIDPSEVNVKENFLPEKLSSYSLWTVGGNHVRTALQEIAQESALNETRNVHIHLYCGLSPEMAVEMGNMHNGSQQTLKPTFQDCVEQGQRYKNESDISEKIAQMMTSLEMKEVPKESVGTIVSVTKYSEKNYQIVKSLFKQFELKNGTFKSIPQTLFRELQGIEDSKRTGFLQHALNHGLQGGVKEVKRSKKRAKLEACFQKVVEVPDMEICRELYPDHLSQINKYTDLDMPKDCIPEIFMDFCKTAKIGDQQILNFEPLIDIKIMYNGKEISNFKSISNFVTKIKNKMTKLLTNHELEIMKEMKESERKCDEDSVSVNDSGLSVSVNDSGLSVSIASESEYESEVNVMDVTQCESVSELDSCDEETQPPTSQDLF